MTKKRAMSVPRGVRNNNPLNIRYVHSNDWEGKKYYSKRDQAFEEFTHMKWGYRAAVVLIRRHIFHNGCTTLSKLIHVWAPSNENFTDHYIDYVCGYTGIACDEDLREISRPDFLAILTAMTHIECGSGYPTKEMMKAMLDGYYLACGIYTREGGVKNE